MRLTTTSAMLVLAAALLPGDAGNASCATAGGPRDALANFQPSRLVAWCIVPFDAAKRGPAERAAMVKRLGLQRVAYDWRQEHVPTFEEEIRQYQQQGIEFFAFWSWHDAIEPLIRKYGIQPQIWITVPSPAEGTQAERVATAAESLRPIAEKTRDLGLRLGLYNHGGWGGEPENLVAVCQQLRSQFPGEHVGIVYNLHHAHERIADFPQSLARMAPYLLCLNLNGMTEQVASDGGQNKILPIGSGKHERDMIQQIVQQGYSGPIGILDHRSEIDAEQSLRENLQGLSKLLQDIH
jgi:sugar phosphate isomerase/epimerase